MTTESRGLTRAQLIQYLQRKAELQEAANKPLVATELYDPSKLSLVTENPPTMVLTKVRLRLILAAMDPNRKKPLIELFIQYYNEEMISYKRQGRHEYLGALQALAETNMSEPNVSLK
ncbi:MAG: hypothetical protein QW212_00765 [Nitrososphaerales archaeon]